MQLAPHRPGRVEGGGNRAGANVSSQGWDPYEHGNPVPCSPWPLGCTCSQPWVHQGRLQPARDLHRGKTQESWPLATPQGAKEPLLQLAGTLSSFPGHRPNGQRLTPAPRAPPGHRRNGEPGTGGVNARRTSLSPTPWGCVAECQGRARLRCAGANWARASNDSRDRPGSVSNQLEA